MVSAAIFHVLGDAMRNYRTRSDVLGATIKRVWMLTGTFLLLLAFLAARILVMQVFSYDRYQEKVLKQITTTSSLRARRGAIYDASGNLLSDSKTQWRIFLSPVDIRDCSKRDDRDYAAEIASDLSSLLDLSYDTVYKRASNSRVLDETILREADEDTYQRVLTLIREKGYSDMVHTEAYYTRYYPSGDLFCHVLGFTGGDSQGLFGLEYRYDDLLSGTDGYYLYAKAANGNELPNQYVGYVPPQDGYSIVTTLDSYLQEQLLYQLNETKATYDAQNRVTGVVMNVNTGAILAMATTDGFDCNDPYTLSELYRDRLAASGLAEGTEEYRKYQTELLYTMWSNKPVSELYEPGSTFKIITACAGIETGATTMDDRYSCTGSLAVGGYNISCHKRGGHGSGFTFAYGLQNSCNPTMMTVAARIGAERFYEYVERFGYLEKTGIDLPGEASSIFHEKDALGTTELATASFGQRFKISVIQQITAVACAANGGKLVTPYLVERIVDAEGNTISEHETTVRREVISEETSRLVAACLEAGVSGDGGAKNAYVAGYKVAAKTGTSQKFDVLDENGNSYLRVGSCVAFAPSDDPEIAVIIVVDEPQNGKYGSMVAAPYVSGFLSKALPYLEHEAVYEEADRTALVGAYSGMTVSTAKKAIEADGLAVRIVGNGDIVLSQSPEPNARLTASLGSVILYTADTSDGYVAVPDVRGLDAESANQRLLAVGLNIAYDGICNYYIGKESVVLSQSSEAGLLVKRGTVIRLQFLYTDDQD